MAGSQGSAHGLAVLVQHGHQRNDLDQAVRWRQQGGGQQGRDGHALFAVWGICALWCVWDPATAPQRDDTRSPERGVRILWYAGCFQPCRQQLRPQEVPRGSGSFRGRIDSPGQTLQVLGLVVFCLCWCVVYISLFASSLSLFLFLFLSPTHTTACLPVSLPASLSLPVQ